MSEQTIPFNEVVEKHFENLDLFTTAIMRAHGKSHPEAFKVRELFEIMKTKVTDTDTNKPELEEEFTQLREVTDNYLVPGDVCETYEAVYNMLAETDKLYHS